MGREIVLRGCKIKMQGSDVIVVCKKEGGEVEKLRLKQVGDDVIINQ